jgi:hypothetical protein
MSSSTTVLLLNLDVIKAYEDTWWEAVQSPEVVDVKRLCQPPGALRLTCVDTAAADRWRQRFGQRAWRTTETVRERQDGRYEALVRVFRWPCALAAGDTLLAPPPVSLTQCPWTIPEGYSYTLVL